jgi:hypothetical protein
LKTRQRKGQEVRFPEAKKEERENQVEFKMREQLDEDEEEGR